MECWSIGDSNRYELRVACCAFKLSARNPRNPQLRHIDINSKTKFQYSITGYSHAGILAH